MLILEEFFRLTGVKSAIGSVAFCDKRPHSPSELRGLRRGEPTVRTGSRSRGMVPRAPHSCIRERVARIHRLWLCGVDRDPSLCTLAVFGLETMVAFSGDSLVCR